MQGDVAQALSVAQKSVFVEPSRSQNRRQLATLAMQAGNPTSAGAILDGTSSASAMGHNEMRHALGAQAIAAAQSDPEAAGVLAQKAVMLAPWEPANWRAYAYSRCSAP